jgi:acyl-CoA synthetase (AMP-forming)/AMP-acid ligase II
MKRYGNQPELTAGVLDKDGWYHTGDLARMDSTGSLILSGRASEMYKTGGENVFPREIEAVLETHPSVLFAAVIGVPDPLYQEVGRAFIMTKSGRQTSAEELREHCRKQLANFKVPKSFDIRPALPLLAIGKVNKQALKEEVLSSGA